MSRYGYELLKNPRGEQLGPRTPVQRENDQGFYELAMDLMGKFGENWALHMLSITKRNAIARVLYYHTLYQQILNVPGVICEFGVQFGGGLSTLMNLRALLEPYNHSRVLYGFDTFNGFKDVAPEDGPGVSAGDYQSAALYEETLEKILRYHESIGPFPDRKKFELVKGDASETIGPWLDENPQAIIAMAIFDMDLYEPTRDALKAVLGRLTKGSLIVFDELNNKPFPGETVALQEVLGTANLRLQSHPLQPFCAWAVV